MLPCVEDWKPDLSQELLDKLDEIGRPLPYLYKIVGETCPFRECHHHLLNRPIRQYKQQCQRYIETDYVREIAGCMCLMDGIIATHRDISSTFDMDVFAVQTLEEKATNTFRRFLKKGGVERQDCIIDEYDLSGYNADE